MNRTARETITQFLGHPRPRTVPLAISQARGRGFLCVSVSAFAAFVALLLTIRAKPRFEREVVLTVAVQRVRHPLISRVMNFISWFGFRPQSLILPATVVAGIWLIGYRREARYLVFAWVASLLSYSTKLVIQRPRPAGDGIKVTKADLRDTSFPSGHTLHYVCFWGFFAYLCYTEIRSRVLQRLSVSFLGMMIASVGPSRVYLGHHWLTDVLGSYSLGVGYLSALIGLHRRHRDE